MKKQFLLLAGTALILASCGSNDSKNQAALQQAQIDSTLNAKMAQHDAENAAKNDSTLKAIEAAKAAVVKEEHHEANERRHDAAAGNQAAPAAGPTTPANPKDARFNTNPNGTPKAATVDPNAPNKKADRFK